MTDDTAFIGVAIAKTGVPPIDYTSDYNILELDYLFWDTASFQRELNESSLSKLFEKTDAVKTSSINLSKFCDKGGNIVIFTGGNTISMDESLKFEDYTILKKFKPNKKQGKRYLFNGNDNVNLILSEIYPEINYYYTLESNNENRIISVPKTNEVIASYTITGGNGIVLAMPLPPGDKIPTVKIKKLIETIKGTTNHEYMQSIPTWTDAYQLIIEKEKRKENEYLSGEIKKIESKIKENELSIYTISEWKHLFSSYDDTLENIAIKAFNTLGFKTVLGPKTHCDIISIKDNTILAIEAKGLKRTAKPTNINQCRRWMSDIVSALDETPEEGDATIKEYVKCFDNLGMKFPTSSDDWNVKGIVLINTFRDTPLEERANPSEPSFNSQVIDRMKRDKMCGMTGIQLLNLALEAQSSPEKADENSDLLIMTEGELASHKNWNQFLSKHETT